MFDFIEDFGNYESRKIGRWDNEDGTQMVSTARVSDGRQPYETAFQHPDYNGGEMVIVEAYNSIGEAEAGHARWVKTITDGPLPDYLQHCQNSQVSTFLDEADLRFDRTA